MMAPNSTPSKSAASVIFFSFNVGSISSTSESKSSLEFTASGFRVILSLSILLISRVSFIRLSRYLQESSILCRYSFICPISSESRESFVKPMMPFIGVRMSWLIRARKSLFARSALSASFSSMICAVMSRPTAQMPITSPAASLTGYFEVEEYLLCPPLSGRGSI